MLLYSGGYKLALRSSDGAITIPAKYSVLADAAAAFFPLSQELLSHKGQQ